MVDTEERNVANSTHNSKAVATVATRFSSIHKMLRMLTYCRRFCTGEKCRILYAEIETTLQAVVRIVQQEGFGDKLKALSQISKKSEIIIIIITNSIRR